MPDKANELAAERLGPLAGLGDSGFGEGGPELPGGANPLGFQ